MMNTNRQKERSATGSTPVKMSDDSNKLESLFYIFGQAFCIII